jgi:putative endonuclease
MNPGPRGGRATTRERKNTGTEGEQIALSSLLERGYHLIARNWRCRSGEIDLILSDGPVLVFVEVKTRHGTAYGLPQEAVGAVKQARIRRLARYYLLVSGCREQEIRFDVVAVTFSGNDAPRIEHLLGAF